MAKAKFVTPIEENTMKSNNSNRREFIKHSIKTGAVISSLSGAMSVSSYSRIIGANDTVRIGMIGTGGRNRWHVGWLDRVSSVEKLSVVAGCDIWSENRGHGANEIKKRFDNEPKMFKNYHELLAQPDIDAVCIATPDHQHCTMLIDAVKAGKDAYVEKPIGMELDNLNDAADAVKSSDRIVQNGSQGRSSAGAAAAKEFMQSGKLGKLLRVEESRSHYIPYWNHYPKPKQESDTDWQAFLFNRPYRPFNADQHASWMGYRDFSSGTVGGWMSHLSDFIHYLTDCGFPQTATSQGGIYATTSEPQRTCTDTVTAILSYAEGFTTLFTTHFGNAYNDYTIFFCEKGTMVVNDPDGNTGGIKPRILGDGSDHAEKIKNAIELDNTTEEDHMTNWIRCIKSRKQPNAHMGYGYMQGVACILADRAYEEGCNMKFDDAKREIIPA